MRNCKKFRTSVLWYSVIHRSMKKLTITLSCFLLLFPFLSYANTFIDTKVNDVRMKVVEYDFSNDEYDIQVWVSDEETELEDLMLTNNGITAVNWVFFCPKDYTQCQDYTFTINERYVEWKKIWFYEDTWERVVFALTEDKSPFLFQTGKINGDKENRIHYGLANFPLLLNNGINQLEHYYDVWLIDYKMKVQSTRNFVCSDKKKEKMYFGLVYDVSLDELVATLYEFWCSDALNLDAGKSTAFIYNGRYIVGPQRPILDWLIISRKWIDVNGLDASWKELSEKIVELISKKRTLFKRIQVLSALDKKLTDIRVKMYDKNSIDLFDETWNTIWYKIDVHDKEVLKKIYTINALQKYIRIVVDNMKVEFEKEKMF